MNERTVAVHGFGGFLRRQKYVALHTLERLIGNQEPKAVAMYGHSPAGVLRIRAHGDKMAGTKFDQLSSVG
jgi:hypothetical protein